MLFLVSAPSPTPMIQVLEDSPLLKAVPYSKPESDESNHNHGKFTSEIHTIKDLFTLFLYQCTPVVSRRCMYSGFTRNFGRDSRLNISIRYSI